jgi:hypothetical protein
VAFEDYADVRMSSSFCKTELYLSDPWKLFSKKGIIKYVKNQSMFPNNRGGSSPCRAAASSLSIELYCTWDDWDDCWEPNEDGSMDQSSDVLPRQFNYTVAQVFDGTSAYVRKLWYRFVN